MDTFKEVCLHRLYLDRFPQCLNTGGQSILANILTTQPISNPIETCLPHQLATCLVELQSNVTMRIPSIHFDSSITLLRARPPPVTIVALRMGVELFVFLFHFAITIPFRLFLWIMSVILFHLHQISIDLFVHRKVETFLLVTCATLLVLFVRRRMTYWRDKNIPFECFTAHLNHFRPFSSLISLNDVDRVRRLGKIFGSFKLTKPVLCIADYQVIQQILCSNSDYFTGQNTWQIEGHLLSESIFANSSTDIQRWKRKKAILLSSFLSRKIKLLKPTIDGLTEELLTYVRVSNLTSAKTKQLRKVAIDSLVFPWLVYSMLALIFDIEMPKYNVFLQQNDLCSALVDSCRRFIHANNQMHQSPLLCLVPSLNRLVNFHLLNKPNLKQIQSVINEAIRYRLDNGLLGLSDCSKRPSKRSVKFRDEVYSSLIAKGKTDVSNDNDNDDTECTNHRPQSPRAQLKELTFIDIILNYEIEPEDKLEGYDLSRPELLDNLTAFFTVSLSTLSKTISGILFYLALYPGEQSKVRQEVIDCVGVRDNINWESLRNLKYTEAFLKEVLRLNPPIERIERVVTKSCNLESNQRQYKLSPGMLCSVLVSAVHQDPEYYPKPNAFRPSRFYDQEQTPESPGFEKPNVNSSKFLAFGLGSRTCIGLKFVMFYLKHLIANVLLEYELQMPQQSIKCYLGKQIPLSHILNCKIQLIARTKTTRKNN